jgi:hypothetical protein
MRRSSAMFPILAAVATANAAARFPAESLVPYPNPLITEIHYNVRNDGDATGDGARDAVGDEFVEIINPHDKPIRLRGFTLLDSDAYAHNSSSHGFAKDKDNGKPPRGKNDNGGNAKQPDKDKRAGSDEDGSRAEVTRQIRFTFPDLELKPGEIAVVFNGYKQRIPGSVGSAERSQGPNENFHDAHVFSMRISSKYAAFDNNGDWVLLEDPDGRPVQLVRWGNPKEKPPQHVPLMEDAPESDGSVQRDGLNGKLRPHDSLKGYEKLMFSPGRFDFPGRSAKKTADSTDDDPPDSERDRKPEKKRP